MAMAAASVPMPVLCSTGASSRNMKKNATNAHQGKDRAVGGLGQFSQVVRNDVQFLKARISKGVGWAYEALRIPQLFKTLDEVLWLRNLEDPNFPAFELPSWPQPYYPELTGIELFVADLKALEVYVGYFYYLSKLWARPLPEVYDPQEVADYFSCRPHVVALRLIEVVGSFASAAIRIRTSGIRTVYMSNVDNDVDRNISQYKFGMVLKQTMLNLGPTFIKVGQSLATRPDIIGSEISKALSELHDQIPPFPRSVAMKIIEEELGPVAACFSSISEEPVAAASFGQVYRGTTLDGFDVAVKVQRPNLRHIVVRDIYILRLGLKLLQKVAKRKSDLRLYADELGKGLVGELDYTLEAANALEFMEAHSAFTFIRVPKALPHLTRKRVLTMEWMDGDNPNDLISISNEELIDHGSKYPPSQIRDARRRLLDLVNNGVEAALVQLLETGLLHADPHPGNLRYTSPGQIGFLDFGLLCRMEKKHQFAMLASILHIVYGDWASLVHALSDMDVVRRPGTSIQRVTMDLEDALGEVEFKDGIPDVKFSRVLGKIWSVALKHHMRMPPYYTLVLRSLASLEGLAVAADPKFKTFEAACPYVIQKLLTDNSAGTRKILHSVVFNKRKEFQWQRLALFLRLGATRKALQPTVTSKSPLDYSPEGATSVINATNLVLRLLIAKDGVVLRRLLMTADGASLIRMMVSKEGILFRQHLCRIIADVMCQWVSKRFGEGFTQHGSLVRFKSGTATFELGSPSRISAPICDYQSILSDRRVKVILLQYLKSARRDPILMLRLCWASISLIAAASALACHRMLVSLSETYLGPPSFAPKQFAASA